MSTIKTILLIGGGFLLAKYALPLSLKNKPELPIIRCEPCNHNGYDVIIDNSVADDRSSIIQPIITSIVELINQVTTNNKKIYY